MAAADPQPDVGQRLAAARLQRGVSQGTVARRAGIASSYISRIETGKVHPTFRTVQRIAKALRVPFDELAGPIAPNDRRPGPCPISQGGVCVLDLIRSEVEVARGVEDEAFTPRQVRLLRRFAAWIRTVRPDRQRAMEILVDELCRGAEAARPSRRT